MFSLSASASVVFEDNFNDGDYTNNPEWIVDSGGNIIVANSTFFSDGIHGDESDRYRTIIHYNVDFSSENKLIISLRGMLRSQGNPQQGRGITLAVVGTNGERYDLRILNGITTGFPINQFNIALGYGADGTLGDYIITSFAPERDVFYNVKAIRENDVWSLYVDDQLIDTHEDTLHINEFNQIHMPLEGSIAIDDVKVETESSEIPEFGAIGIITMIGILGLFIFLKSGKEN